MQTANSLFRNPFKLNWPFKPRNEWPIRERRKSSLKPVITIHSIPVRVLKQILCYVITDTPISSLRQVCRGWNTTISNIIIDEITKCSPELTLFMRCQTNSGEIVNMELPLERGGLSNRCKAEFSPRIDDKLEKYLFVDSYKLIQFYLFYKIGKNDFVRKEEIASFSMRSFKFDGPIVKANGVIELDLAFQYIPYEPLTFRVKLISFSPVYLLNLFNIKNKKIDYKW